MFRLRAWPIPVLDEYKVSSKSALEKEEKQEIRLKKKTNILKTSPSFLFPFNSVFRPLKKNLTRQCIRITVIDLLTWNFKGIKKIKKKKSKKLRRRIHSI